MTEGHCKPNMKVNDRNIVTASGDSDPQMPAGRSEQAGSCRSSSNDCRDTGVASQAPVILSATSAEKSNGSMTKSKLAELEKEMKEVDDTTLSGWTYEVWTGVDDDLKKMDVLVNRLFAFTSQTRNVHKEVKTMSSELNNIMKRALARSQELGVIADKTYERVRDLSIRSMSLVATTAATTTPAEEVVGKRIEKERASVQERKKKKAKMKPESRKTHSPPAQGIIITKGKGESTYADMVKKLKEEIDLESIGVQIKSVKRTKEDGIFMLVGKGGKATEEAKKLKRAAEDVLGGDVEVRDASRPLLIEIRGIGQEEKAEDVVSGVCRYGAIPEGVRVKKLGPSFGGTQRALVSVSAEIAGKAIAAGRVLVGLISCGVRLKANPAIRCYRCHGYNHKAFTCRGPDRRKLCMTCGGEDHVAKQCRSAPNCVLCKEMERKADHYPGSGRCEAYRKMVERETGARSYDWMRHHPGGHAVSYVRQQKELECGGQVHRCGTCQERR